MGVRILKGFHVRNFDESDMRFLPTLRSRRR